MLTSLAYVLLLGMALGALARRLRLPSLVGMLLAGILLLALPAAWKWFVEVYFPLLRYIVDSAAEMPDLYSGYGVRLFASSLSLPAMFFILHLVVKKIFLRSFLHTAWEHVKNKT